MKHILPTCFIEKINTVPTTKRRKKLIKLCNIMLHNMAKSSSEYVELPKNYLVEIFNSKYHKIIKDAIKIGLIEAIPYDFYGTVFYIPDKGKAKRYSFVDDYMSDAPSAIEVKEGETNDIFEQMKTLVIPGALLEKIQLMAEKKAQEVVVYKQKRYFTEISFLGEKKKMTYTEAYYTAEKNNCEILKDGNNFVIANLEDYRKLKKKRCSFYNRLNLQKLINQDFTINRNGNNMRLDYNLTNCSREIIKEILIYNKKVEIDLSCSQYTLLANIMMFTIKNFIEESEIKSYNSLYQHLKMTSSTTVDSIISGAAPEMISSTYVPSIIQELTGVSNDVISRNQMELDEDFNYHSLNENSKNQISISNTGSSDLFPKDSCYNRASHYVDTFLSNPLFTGVYNRFKTTFSRFVSSFFFQNLAFNFDSFCRELASFARLCFSGALYQFVSSELAIPLSEAKTLMMEIFFSSEKHYSEQRTKLKEVFPLFIQFIDYFKSANAADYLESNPSKRGNGCFPVALQQLEAALFIDTLLPALRDQDLFALPKHDSLIVDADKHAAAMEIIQGILDGIGFKYHFKSTGETKQSIQSEKIESVNSQLFYVKEGYETHPMLSDEAIKAQERTNKPVADRFYYYDNYNYADELTPLELGFQLNADGKWFFAVPKKKSAHDRK